MINPERGEVYLKIEDVELVLGAEMEGLAALSAYMKSDSLSDMTRRLLGGEVNAVMAGISCLAIQGDKEKAIKKLKLRHFPACIVAFTNIFKHHMGEALEEKKEQAAGEAPTTESPGGAGVGLRSVR